MVQRERDLLLKEKLSALHRMLITDRVLSLGIVAARLGHYVRNSLVAVRAFLDLAAETGSSRRKVDAEDACEIRTFGRSFTRRAQAQIRRITGSVDRPCQRHRYGPTPSQSRSIATWMKPVPAEPWRN